MDKYKKIIIDTDIGDDIDDLFTLYLANSFENVELLGVTTVYGNTFLRARQVNKFASLANLKSLQVYAGYGVPLKTLHPLSENHIICQYGEELNDDSLKALNEDSKDVSKAVDYLISSANKYKDELTIVCIGPLTNIAYAILKDKKAMQKCNFVIMGGCFNKIEREWNIACDYKAAKIVFESGLNITCVGVDVTKKVEISNELQKNILKASKDEYLNYLITCCNRWFNVTKRKIILHDPLTLYSVINPSIMTYKEYYVRVEDKGKITRALTVPMEELLWVQFNEKNYKRVRKVKCAQSVKKKEFINVFQNQLGF